MGDGGYDWWAAEGRPEHLRFLNDAGSAISLDPVLEAAGIVYFGSGVDLKRELLQLEVAAPDAAEAKRLIAERYPIAFELEVTAPAGYVDKAIRWDWWKLDPDDPTGLIVWADARVDDRGLYAAATEDPTDVVVELRGAVWQGARDAMYAPEATKVQLARAPGSRTVRDAIDGRARPNRPPRV